ncbi:uncharacterized protein [Panulirus ornatus]|uniref:uncharacterized protein isoform X1 n=1 Tax=Panulirus ornatus TaxID=150431 RepID=UPI003A8C1DE2
MCDLRWPASAGKLCRGLYPSCGSEHHAWCGGGRPVSSHHLRRHTSSRRVSSSSPPPPPPTTPAAAENANGHFGATRCLPVDDCHAHVQVFMTGERHFRHLMTAGWTFGIPVASLDKERDSRRWLKSLLNGCASLDSGSMFTRRWSKASPTVVQALLNGSSKLTEPWFKVLRESSSLIQRAAASCFPTMDRSLALPSACSVLQTTMGHAK